MSFLISDRGVAFILRNSDWSHDVVSVKWGGRLTNEMCSVSVDDQKCVEVKRRKLSIDRFGVTADLVGLAFHLAHLADPKT